MSLYFDGACHNNPGESSFASIIKTNSRIIRIAKYSNYATNNESEYNSLIIGLEKAIELDIKELDIFGDSKLVIMQSQNKWKVKSENLIPLHKKVIELIKKFNKITFNHVLREFNKEADSLANECIDSKNNIFLEIFI